MKQVLFLLFLLTLYDCQNKAPYPKAEITIKHLGYFMSYELYSQHIKLPYDMPNFAVDSTSRCIEVLKLNNSTNDSLIFYCNPLGIALTGECPCFNIKGTDTIPRGKIMNDMLFEFKDSIVVKPQQQRILYIYSSAFLCPANIIKIRIPYRNISENTKHEVDVAISLSEHSVLNPKDINQLIDQ